MQFCAFATVKIGLDKPATDGHWGSGGSWTMILTLTLVILGCLAAHFRHTTRRFARMGGVVPPTLMGMANRLLPIDRFLDLCAVLASSGGAGGGGGMQLERAPAAGKQYACDERSSL